MQLNENKSMFKFTGTGGTIPVNIYLRSWITALKPLSQPLILNIVDLRIYAAEQKREIIRIYNLWVKNNN